MSTNFMALSQKQKDLGEEGLKTWKAILSQHAKTRNNQIIDLFQSGIDILGIQEDKIPDLQKINKILKEKSGFQGIFVDGFEEGKSFYGMLAERIFPIGNFIRDRQDISYTPAPDIVHDLYGHLPFLTNKKYADFCQKLGELACKYIDQPEKHRQFERFFWFTIEFGLIKTPKGNRIFGAGIASSLGECEYALSEKPEVLPFSVDAIRHQEFNIDEMQKRLFLIDNLDQLYSSLDILNAKVSKE